MLSTDTKLAATARGALQLASTATAAASPPPPHLLPAHLRDVRHHNVGTVGGLARRAARRLPPLLQGQAAQVAGLAAAHGACWVGDEPRGFVGVGVGWGDWDLLHAGRRKEGEARCLPGPCLSGDRPRCRPGCLLGQSGHRLADTITGHRGRQAGGAGVLHRRHTPAPLQPPPAPPVPTKLSSGACHRCARKLMQLRRVWWGGGGGEDARQGSAGDPCTLLACPAMSLAGTWSPPPPTRLCR